MVEDASVPFGRLDLGSRTRWMALALALVALVGCRRFHRRHVRGRARHHAVVAVVASSGLDGAVDAKALGPTEPDAAPSSVVEIQDAGPPELVEILIAKSAMAGGPLIRTALWCNEPSASKYFFWNHVFEALPAIAVDGKTLAVVEEDRADGPSSRGASLLLLDENGVELRRVLLWTVAESENGGRSGPECRAQQPVMHARFVKAEEALRTHDWRAMKFLPKRFRVAPTYDSLESSAGPDGGLVYYPHMGTRLELLTIFDEKDAKVVEVAPCNWLASELAKAPPIPHWLGVCASVAPGPPIWIDEESRTMAIRFEAACHAHSITDPPPRFYVAHY